MNEVKPESSNLIKVFQNITAEIELKDTAPKAIVFKGSDTDAKNAFKTNVSVGNLSVLDIDLDRKIPNRSQDFDIEAYLKGSDIKDAILLLNVSEKNMYSLDYFRWLKRNLDHIGRICRDERSVIKGRNIYTFLLLPESDFQTFKTSTTGNVRDPSMYFI